MSQIPPTNLPTPAPTNSPTVSSNAKITDEAILSVAGSPEGYQFGRSVAIFGESTLIGAPNANDRGSPLGAAYLFETVSLLAMTSLLIF